MSCRLSFHVPSFFKHFPLLSSHFTQHLELVTHISFLEKERIISTSILFLFTFFIPFPLFCSSPLLHPVSSDKSCGCHVWFISKRREEKNQNVCDCALIYGSLHEPFLFPPSLHHQQHFYFASLSLLHFIIILPLHGTTLNSIVMNTFGHVSVEGKSILPQPPPPPIAPLQRSPTCQPSLFSFILSLHPHHHLPFIATTSNWRRTVSCNIGNFFSPSFLPLHPSKSVFCSPYLLLLLLLSFFWKLHMKERRQSVVEPWVKCRLQEELRRLSVWMKKVMEIKRITVSCIKVLFAEGRVRKRLIKNKTVVKVKGL